MFPVLDDNGYVNSKLDDSCKLLQNYLYKKLQILILAKYYRGYQKYGYFCFIKLLKGLLQFYQ